MPETTPGDPEPVGDAAIDASTEGTDAALSGNGNAGAEAGDDLLEQSGSVGDDVVDTGGAAGNGSRTGEDDEAEAGVGDAAPATRPARARTRDKVAAEAPPPAKGRKFGRVTPKGGPGNQAAARSGRYTPPIPKEKRKSPPWYGWVLLAFLVVGLLLIVLNYVNVLPGGTSNWYLIAGIASIVVGLFMATFYH